MLPVVCTRCVRFIDKNYFSSLCWHHIKKPNNIRYKLSHPKCPHFTITISIQWAKTVNSSVISCVTFMLFHNIRPVMCMQRHWRLWPCKNLTRPNERKVLKARIQRTIWPASTSVKSRLEQWTVIKETWLEYNLGLLHGSDCKEDEGADFWKALWQV